MTNSVFIRLFQVEMNIKDSAITTRTTVKASDHSRTCSTARIIDRVISRAAQTITADSTMPPHLQVTISSENLARININPNDKPIKAPRRRLPLLIKTIDRSKVARRVGINNGDPSAAVPLNLREVALLVSNRAVAAINDSIRQMISSNAVSKATSPQNFPAHQIHVMVAATAVSKSR